MKVDKFARRLLKLRGRLLVVKPDRFSFARWAGQDWKGKANLSCGTTACALGHATAMPSFRKLGLRLFRRDGIAGTGMGTPWIGMKGQPLTDLSPQIASATIFGTTPSEFRFLFLPLSDLGDVELREQRERYGRQSPSRMASAQDVAAHIAFFVKHKYGVDP